MSLRPLAPHRPARPRPVSPGLAVAIPAALFMLIPAGTSVRAGDSAAADRAVLSACLDLVNKNQTEHARHDASDPKEKIGPAGRLAAAQADAPRQEESCVGAVSGVCIRADGESTAAMVQCYGREADAWDARLNTAYKTLLAQSDDKETAEGLRKTQRAWIAFRDAACAQAALSFKGGTLAGPISIQCVMEMTARQSIWLQGWLLQ